MTAVREALATAQRSAMHLESRDSYWVGTESDSFAAWKAGYRRDPADRASWWRPWLDVIQQTVTRGVQIRRARIVSEPVSEYTRYSYDGAFTNIAAGEQIRWLPRRRSTDLLIPPVDFWVFDESTIIFNHFTGDGDWANPGMEVVTDAALAKQVTTAFETVWDRAIPHEEYSP